jgi:hypothetical protein
VSWGYRLTGDALADLRGLSVFLQEDVLDELDQLSEHQPPAIPGPAEFIHDFERRSREGKRLVVFLRVLREDARRTLTVLGIGAATAPEV